MRILLTVVILVSMAACGSSTTPSEPAPPPSSNPNRITITASGVAPSELTVPIGATVLFVNNDSRVHDMTSDPHPDHSDCPPLNLVGRLGAGQSRETGNLVVARTCGFHDHENPTVRSLTGRIFIR